VRGLGASGVELGYLGDQDLGHQLGAAPVRAVLGGKSR
jgi:hypothetical protein